MQQVERLRGRNWVRIRRHLLMIEPLCRSCAAQGRVRAAVEIDHIVPLHKGGTYDQGNMQPLCKRCHQAKSAAEEAERAGVKKNQVKLNGEPQGWGTKAFDPVKRVGK